MEKTNNIHSIDVYEGPSYTKIFITYRQQSCCQSQEQKLIQTLETKLSHATQDIYLAATLLGLDYKIFVSTTTSETGESISIIKLKTQT